MLGGVGRRGWCQNGKSTAMRQTAAFPVRPQGCDRMRPDSASRHPTNGGRMYIACVGAVVLLGLHINVNLGRSQVLVAGKIQLEILWPQIHCQYATGRVADYRPNTP